MFFYGQLLIISRINGIIDVYILYSSLSFMQAITALDGVDMQVLSVDNSEEVCSIDSTISGFCGGNSTA